MQLPMTLLFVVSDKLETKRQELVLELQQAASRQAATCVQGDNNLSVANSLHIFAQNSMTAKRSVLCY